MSSAQLPESIVLLSLLVVLPFLVFLCLHLLKCVKTFETLKSFTVADETNSVGLLAAISIPYGSVGFFILTCGPAETFLSGFGWLYSTIGYVLAVATGYYLISPIFHATEKSDIFSYLSARLNSSAITTITACIYVLFSFSLAVVSLCSTIKLISWLFQYDSVITVLSTLLIWAVSLTVATVDGLYGLQVFDCFFCVLSVTSSLAVGYYLYDFNGTQSGKSLSSFEALTKRSESSNVFGWISGSWCWFTFFLTLSPSTTHKLYGWKAEDSTGRIFLSSILPGLFLFFYALLLGVFISVRSPNATDLSPLQQLFLSANNTGLGVRGVAGGFLCLLSVGMIATFLHTTAVVVGQTMAVLNKLRVDNFTVGVWKSRAVAAAENVIGVRIITLISGGILLLICTIVLTTVDDVEVVSTLLPMYKTTQTLMIGPLLGLILLTIFVPIANHQSALLAYCVGLGTAAVLAVVGSTQLPQICNGCEHIGNSTPADMDPPNMSDSFQCDPMLSCFITTLLTLAIGFSASWLTGGSETPVEPNMVSPKCLRLSLYLADRQIFGKVSAEPSGKRDKDTLERPKWIRSVRNSFRHARHLLPEVVYHNPRVQRMQQESTL